MGMWVFSLICSLLAPLTMVLFGFLWKTRPPRDINSLYGYRTAMSSKNQQTWFFAHACISRLWRRLGLATLVLSIFVYGLGSLALAGWRWSQLGVEENLDRTGFLILGIVTVQMIVLVGSIFPVERALKRRFDGEGKPRPE